MKSNSTKRIAKTNSSSKKQIVKPESDKSQKYALLSVAWLLAVYIFGSIAIDTGSMYVYLALIASAYFAANTVYEMIRAINSSPVKIQPGGKRSKA